MPITPFHMGPGMLIKAILQGFFSLIIFGWAQLLMDIQPILVVLTGKGNLHGFSHTYIGATLIAIFSVLTGRWIYQAVMVFIKKDFSNYQKKLFNVPKELTMRVCVVSAFIGTYSHVLLDSIMHADVEPYYPIYLANDINLIISVENLHKFCVYTGLFGIVIFFTIRSVKLKK
jgi:Domain of unknown function (DUF4184)